MYDSISIRVFALNDPAARMRSGWRRRKPGREAGEAEAEEDEGAGAAAGAPGPVARVN